MADTEPRRSIRSTKGQHKALEQMGQPIEAKRRGRKTGKKFEDKQDDSEEEVIRCVCGATEQDGDPGEPWIACDRCGAWQHNVCMGMSVYSEDLAKDYFCEQCKPENHKELLEGISKGERPWEQRRKIYEEEKTNEKKRRGGRKAKPKRNSDIREESVKASPPPELKRDAKTVVGAKRKSWPGSEDQDVKVVQKRKLSESESISTYIPPADLVENIGELPESRQSPAKGLLQALSSALQALQKKGALDPESSASVATIAARFSIQIERAAYDEHPIHKDYAAQIRTLRFNLKENTDLCSRLLAGTLTPTILAAMTSDELASRELQRMTAKMKAQAERQSILESEEAAPRLRRTHKGEELVERDNTNIASEDKPPAFRRASLRGPSSDSSPKDGQANAKQHPGPAKGKLHVDTTHRSGKGDFDIKKVFSSVRSPETPQINHQAQSLMQSSSAGPGTDPEIDRLLQDDDTESPPYSPTDESDPDVVWRGNIVMNTMVNFQATARHVGGVNLAATIGLPWSTLVPKTLTVAGRISEQIATEYLCSLRYSAPTDVTVASLSPATDSAKAGFLTLVDYFISRKRYGVVGEKGVGNVRDTYLVPLPAGTDSHPEFMLNLEDNFLPTSRAAPMLLLVVVYRNDEAAMEKLRGPNWTGLYNAPDSSTPTPINTGFRTLDSATVSSPFTARPNSSHIIPTPTPVHSIQAPITMQGTHPLPPLAVSNPSAHSSSSVLPINASQEMSKEQAQRAGEAVAREILGPFATCSTAIFLMSQAARMQKSEWILVRSVFANKPQARDDLQFLKVELERYQEEHSARPVQTPVPIPRVPHTLSPRSSQPPAPGSLPTAP